VNKTLKTLAFGIAFLTSLGINSPAFSAVPQFDAPIQSLESSQLRHVGNFDGDSFADLLLLSQDKLIYRKGIGNGDFGGPVVSVLGLQLFSTTRTAVGDLTGDKIDDFAFMVPFGKDLQIYKGSPQGVFTLYRSVELDYGVSKPVIGKFNSDTFEDVLITSSSIWGGNYFLEGTATGLSTIKVEYKDGFYPNGMRCDISQISRISPTGLPAFLCIGSSSIGIVPMISATQPSIVNGYSSPYTSYPEDRHYAIGDFSGDGLLDVAALRGNSGAISLLIYENSNLGLNTPKNLSTSPISWQDQLFASDLDGDGRSDLILFRPNSQTLYSINQGGLKFQTFQVLTTNLANDALTIEDVNGDGLGDFIYSGNSRVSVALTINVIKIEAEKKAAAEKAAAEKAAAEKAAAEKAAAEKAAAEKAAAEKAAAEKAAAEKAAADTELNLNFGSVVATLNRYKKDISKLFSDYPLYFQQNIELKSSLQRAIDYNIPSIASQSEIDSIRNLIAGGTKTALASDFLIAQSGIKSYLAQEASKSKTTKRTTTITCTKGKQIKKVTAVSPRCPSGFKKK
jgi:hypothetical protein